MYPTRPSVILSSLLLLGARSVAADCSPAWSTMAQDLLASFGACGDYARQGIRAAYHDSAPLAADGSLVLSNECEDRPENTQIRPYCTLIKNKANQYGLGAADAIQLGLVVGVYSCHGPVLKFLVGRKDSYEPNPPNQLPNATSSAEEQLAVFTKFAAMNFTVSDVVALLGSHTTATNLTGVALDTTVSKWDNNFYSSTLYHQSPATLQSDYNVATDSKTTQAFHSFAMSEIGWEYSFAQAYGKMSVIGVDTATLTDCTSSIEAVLPK